MKRIFWSAIALAPLALAGSAAAQYHRSTDGTLLCADCHVMHYSQGHGYNSDGTGLYTPLAGGPHEYLLRNTINNLCLSCHNGQVFAPDVFETNTGSAVRSAGALNRLTSAGPYYMQDGHTLDSNAVAPGGTWKATDDTPQELGLNCINCHLQHGRNYTSGAISFPTWRNLRWSLGQTGSTTAPLSYEKAATANYTKDIWWNSSYSGSEYDERAMELCEPNTTTSVMAEWCGACHDNFHGVPGSTNIGGVAGTGGFYAEFDRHPVSGVDVGDLGGGHSRLSQFWARTNRVKVMSNGDWYDVGAAGDTTDITPTCTTCHKGHGNKNAFGLIYRSGGGALSEEGDALGTQLEALCGQCHGQGSFYSKT